jgi:hypothetical protein
MASTSLFSMLTSKQDVDARPKAGHDEVRDQGNDNNNR